MRCVDRMTELAYGAALNMTGVPGCRSGQRVVSASGHVDEMATWQAGSGFAVENELTWSRHTSFACN